MEENIDNNENPFSEEFSREDVVNSGEIEENEEKAPNRKKLLDDNDIQEIIELDEEARRAIAFVDEFANDDEKVSSVIKKADAEKADNILEADLEDLSSYAKKIKKSSNKDIIDDENQAEEKNDDDDQNSDYNDINVQEPSEYTEFLKQEQRKRDEFNDFLKLPKISGKERRHESMHLIPGEKVNNRQKKVELIDDPQDHSEHEKTFVEINRDENGELESISIICKCGEKTIIDFDYIESEEETNTEVINNKINPEPLDYGKELIEEHENIPQMMDEDQVIDESRSKIVNPIYEQQKELKDKS